MDLFELNSTITSDDVVEANSRLYTPFHGEENVKTFIKFQKTQKFVALEAMNVKTTINSFRRNFKTKAKNNFVQFLPERHVQPLNNYI